jgi:chromosome partitioning protein
MRIWTVANQKGGVGKTTTAISLAGLLAEAGETTLLVDLDPHGSLSAYLGHDPDAVENGVYRLFRDADAHPASLVHATRVEGMDLMPASTALATLDRQLGAQDGKGLVLTRALARLGQRYRRVIIDCPPMLGVSMVNALAACERLIIPVQTEFLALKGLERMMHTLTMIARALHKQLPCVVVPTLYDRRTRAGNDTLEALREQYGHDLWPGVIPIDTLFREASRAGLPLNRMQAHARGVEGYRELLHYLIEGERPAREAVAQ